MALTVPAPSKLTMGAVTARTIFAALTRSVTSPFKGSKGAPTYFRDVAYAAFRTNLRLSTIPIDKFLNKSTEETYLDTAKARGFQPETVVLADGTKAHWIGNKNAELTLVYFCGGGYVVPASPGHLDYLYDLTTTLSQAGPPFSTLILDYTLAPEAPYPRQLQQASTLLTYLLADLNRSPSSLILAGDSAGGNLVTSLLGHALHPHPAMLALPTISTPFKAVVLISPWVSFSFTAKSFRDNAETDVFDSSPLQRWSTAFLGHEDADRGDYYSEPNLAPKDWWHGLDKIANEILIWGGGGEVLVDGIRSFAAKLKAGFEEGKASGATESAPSGEYHPGEMPVGGEPVSAPVAVGSAPSGEYHPGEAPVGGETGAVVWRTGVTYVESEKECHDQMIFDRLLGYKEQTEGGKAVEGWIRSKL